MGELVICILLVHSTMGSTLRHVSTLRSLTIAVPAELKHEVHHLMMEIDDITVCSLCTITPLVHQGVLAIPAGYL